MLVFICEFLCSFVSKRGVLYCRCVSTWCVPIALMYMFAWFALVYFSFLAMFVIMSVRYCRSRDSCSCDIRVYTSVPVMILVALFCTVWSLFMCCGNVYPQAGLAYVSIERIKSVNLFYVRMGYNWVSLLAVFARVYFMWPRKVSFMSSITPRYLVFSVCSSCL